MSLIIKFSNQKFIIFLNKIQTAIVGVKGFKYFPVLDQLDSDTLSDGRIWLQLLLFPAQFPLHGKCLQKNWTLGQCLNGHSCTVYHVTSDPVGGFWVSKQYKYHGTCPSCWRWRWKLFCHFRLHAPTLLKENWKSNQGWLVSPSILLKRTIIVTKYQKLKNRNII